MTETQKEKVSVEVKRVNGALVFGFAIPEMLENIFKEKSVEVRTSEKWPDNKFYFCPAITNNEAYKALLAEYGLFDDYGKDIMNSAGQFNVAFMRTVGGKGNIPLVPPVAFSVLSDRVRTLTRFIRAYYEQFIGAFRIGGTVEFEVE